MVNVNSHAQVNCMQEIGSVVILFVYIDQLSISPTVQTNISDNVALPLLGPVETFLLIFAEGY